MRNLLKSLIVVALVLPVAAAAQIATTPHNLSLTGPGVAGQTRSGTETQICKFCHAPHGVGAANQPLIWNRSQTSAAGFTGTLATAAGTALPVAAQIGGASKACLSCHDGVIALGAIIAPAPVADLPNPIPAGLARIGNAGSINGNHPVSVPYPGISVTYTPAGAAAPNPSGYAAAGVATGYVVAPVAAIRIFRDAANNAGIECGSCHDAHDNANTNFLRLGNGGSALCLACHTK